MRQLGLAVLCFVMLGCSKEAEEMAEGPTPARRTIAEVRPDLPRQVETPNKVERTKPERKLGLSAEEYKNLSIEEQKELIRKQRGRK